MSVTYGFYDSIGGDRKYNAEQFDSIFKGIINDGIFKNIGGALKVTTPGALTLSVATGKCWFNNKWVENDATLNLTAPAAHSVYDRIDAVIVEIDSSTPKRECSIKILEGTPSSSPVRPTLKQDSVNKIWQYALAYYTVAKTATVISGLTDVRGTTQTQWITNSTIVSEFNQIISDEWVQKTYNPGEYAISENKLWKCLVANNVMPSEGSNWTQVRVDTEILERTSHIGMIIHTTTLNTEEKVKAIYGGTRWISHSGYMLRGATSSVTPNSNTKDGGNDNAIIPYHNHSISAWKTTDGAGGHYHTYDTTIYTSGSSGWRSKIDAGGSSGTLSTNTTGSHNHTLRATNTNYAGTNGNTANANIPNYKSVYIWERVS